MNSTIKGRPVIVVTVTQYRFTFTYSDVVVHLCVVVN